MKQRISFRDYVLAGIIFGCVGLSYGSTEENLKEEENFGWGSPVPLSPEPSDEESSFGVFSSGTSFSDSEEEKGERSDTRSRVKKTKEFFEEKYRQRKSHQRSMETPDSSYESETEEPTSHRDQKAILKKEAQSVEEQARNRALQALSQQLDKQVYKWNHFEVPISQDSLDEMRKKAQKKFEELAAEFVKKTPILNQKGSEENIKGVIGVKVSQIMGSLRHKWEIWGGQPD